MKIFIFSILKVFSLR